MNNYKLACNFNDYELARERKFVPNSFETSFNLIKTLFRKIEKSFQLIKQDSRKKGMYQKCLKVMKDQETKFLSIINELENQLEKDKNSIQTL